MSLLTDLLVGFLAALCQVSGVTPDSLGRGKRGNRPPPQGGHMTIHRF